MYPTPLPQNQTPYQPAAFLALPTGAVIPRGWLRAQLEVQANGISGHLDEYWPDVGAQCGWLGGPGDDWERAPYYCDGLLPLALLLDAAGSAHGPRLLAKAMRYVDWMLQSRRANGNFGPANPDWWPRMVALKVLMTYYEGGLAAGSPDGRVLDLMAAYFAYMDDMLDALPLHTWGAARGSDNLLAVHWLYNRGGEKALLALGEKIQRQTMDWPDLQGRYSLARALPHRQFRGNMGTHVVNNAQGIKTGAVWYAQSGAEWHRRAPLLSIENLMRHHGQAHGMWSGDEHLNGRSPTAGVELCAVVEYMYSLEELLRILGEPVFGDILERVGYNALPATFRADMWAHQYDQQVNQVAATWARRNWTDNSDDANTFGQTPNFGCCQANFHQGWPKLARSLVMATPDGGLAVTAWGPCEARAALPAADARLEIDTAYPFGEDAILRVRLPNAGAGQRARFPLLLRVPAWAGEDMRVTIAAQDGAAQPELRGTAGGGFMRLERDWADGDEVRARLPMPARLEEGHNGLLSALRGPLLLALPLGEEWVKYPPEQHWGRPLAADWEVYPTTPWNYGLALDPRNPPALRIETRPPGAAPFGAPAALTVKVPARRLPGWGLERNSAADLPGGPHPGGPALEEVALVPYGSTCLRVAAFPRARG